MLPGLGENENGQAKHNDFLSAIGYGFVVLLLLPLIFFPASVSVLHILIICVSIAVLLESEAIGHQTPPALLFKGQRMARAGRGCSGKEARRAKTVE